MQISMGKYDLSLRVKSPKRIIQLVFSCVDKISQVAPESGFSLESSGLISFKMRPPAPGTGRNLTTEFWVMITSVRSVLSLVMRASQNTSLATSQLNLV